MVRQNNFSKILHFFSKQHLTFPVISAIVKTWKVSKYNNGI